MRVDRQDGVERTLDVLDRATAGREEDRLAERGHVPEQRSVHQIGRCDLERGQVELGEEVRTRLVEDGAEEHDSFLARELAKLEPGCGVQLQGLAVLSVRRAEGVLVVVGRVVQGTRVERAVVALLQLDRVDPALLRSVDQRLRLVDVSLVVVTDLGDDVDGLVVGDASSVYEELGHRHDRTQLSCSRVGSRSTVRACRMTSSPTSREGMSSTATRTRPHPSLAISVP